MSLFDNNGIVNVYRKNDKKSIWFSERIDLFLVLSLLILLAAPLITGSVSRSAALNKLTKLTLSPRCAELFGRDLTEALLREFEERNPDLRIILSDGDASSQTGPDILIFDEGDFYGLTKNKALVSLESYIDYDTGEMYAVPLVSFMDLLFYNIDLLKAAGFDRPPKTREEFLNYAKTISGNTSGSYGTALSLSPADRQAMSRDIFSWIWAAGGDFWQTEGKPVINSRTIITDISFLGSLYREGVPAPLSFYTTGEQRLEEFANGKIAMMVASTRSIPALRERMGDDAFSITTIPGSGSAGKYSIGISSFYTGISVACAYPEEAWSFLEFLAERSPFLCEELKAVPGIVSDLFFGNYIKDDPFYSKARDIFDSSQVVYGFSGKPDAEELETAVLEEMRVFFETGRTAQETANAIQWRWDMFFLYE
jgi:multiple sugar transport system substrate-binding protein